MWYLCFQSVSPSLTSCQLSRILALMEKWSNPVWKILFLKATPGTGKLPILCLCQNALSMEGSRQSMSLKSLQSEVSRGVLSHGMIFVIIVVWGIFVCQWTVMVMVWSWFCLFYSVVDGFGFSERKTKGRVNWKNCQTENRKVPTFWNNLADGLVLPLR